MINPEIFSFSSSLINYSVLHLQTTVDNDTFYPQDETDRTLTAEEATVASGEQLALPPSGNTSSNSIAVGETVQLHELGPIIGA